MNSRIVVIFLLIAGFGARTKAQERYYTKNGEIIFLSKAPLETITAVNRNATCVLDTKNGNLQLLVLLKGFTFPKALMQEHFNENYVESDKFPKSEFKGNVVNTADIDYSKNGQYTARVKGTLTLHGVTNQVDATGTISVTDGKIKLNSSFNIELSDYKIAVPGIVADKVSKTVKISVNCSLDPLKTS